MQCVVAVLCADLMGEIAVFGVALFGLACAAHYMIQEDGE